MKRVLFLKIAVILFTLLVILEIYLRAIWGFCDSVLMMESDKYEYIAQPNQERFRFRNHILYNKYSMRTSEVDSSAMIILGLGDSVLNGGVAVDQDSLATTLLTSMIGKSLRRKVQVLNISAGSWGPDNCYAYLQEKGDFNAKAMFLVVSSHDAHDNMDFGKVVDKALRYESKQYKIAIVELIHKYVIPEILHRNQLEGIAIEKKGVAFNAGFKELAEYSRIKNIPFFVYLHPDINELAQHQYNSQGEEIINFCKENNIECIQSLHSMSQENYRGGIHLNDSGQRKLAEDLYPALSDLFKHDNPVSTVTE